MGKANSMTTTSQDLRHDLVKLIRNTERRLEAAGDLDPLMDAIGDAHYALHPLHAQPLSRTPPAPIRGGYSESARLGIV